MKFEHQYDDTSEKITFEVPKDADIDEVMDCFRRFLMACTYAEKTVIDGFTHIANDYEDVE